MCRIRRRLTRAQTLLGRPAALAAVLEPCLPATLAMTASLTPYRTAVHRLSIARLVAVTGAEAGFVALVAAMFQRTGSATWGSAVLIAAITTGGLFAPIAGTLGDRLDRKRVIIVSELATAVTTLALVFFQAPVEVVVIAAFGAIAQAPLFAASQAAIPNLVPADRVIWANAVRTRANSIGFMLGPVLGGLLIATSGTTLVFIVNAVALLSSAALTSTIHGTFNEQRKGADRHGMTAGFGFVWADRVLRMLVAAWFVCLLGVGTLLVAEYPLAEVFGMGSFGYGLLIGTWGAGTLVGTLAAERLVPRSAYWALVAGMAVMAVMLGSVAIAPWFVLICATQLVGGFADSHVNVAEQTVTQERTPDILRSRVFAANEAIMLAALGLSMAAGGPLTDAFGPRFAYGATGVSMLVATVMLAFGVRELRASRVHQDAAVAHAYVVDGYPHAGIIGTATILDAELPAMPWATDDEPARAAVRSR